MNRRSMILRGAAVIIAWFALLELGRYGMLRFQSAGSVWGVKLTAAAIFAGTDGILLGVQRWLCRHTEEFKGVSSHAKRLRMIALILFAMALVMLLVEEIEIH